MTRHRKNILKRPPCSHLHKPLITTPLTKQHGGTLLTKQHSASFFIGRFNALAHRPTMKNQNHKTKFHSLNLNLIQSTASTIQYSLRWTPRQYVLDIGCGHGMNDILESRLCRIRSIQQFLFQPLSRLLIIHLQFESPVHVMFDHFVIDHIGKG